MKSRLLVILFSLASLLVSSAHRIAAEGPAPFRVLTYNVLYGFNHGKSADLGARWIAGRYPDIVALQEMNGFTQDSLAALAKRWGHEHAVILKEDGFPVALTANSPIEVIEKRLEDMWHGYLHCKVRGVHVFVVHLSPSKHEVRLREAGILTTKIKPLLANDERVLLMGDFNTNSPLDMQWLEPRPYVAAWRQQEPENADPGYLTMRAFLEAGLFDLVREKRPTTEVSRGTFATTIKEQARPGRQWRIDFILADPGLALRCIDARTTDDPLVHQISDHFPVQASFR